MKDEIKTFIIDTFFVDEFEDDASFLAEGILDSTGVLELVGFLEETYKLKVEDDELIPENLDSLNNVCAFVQRRQQAAA
jgi:acyl carrier protein